jgi:3-deoxy-manno-octulosonate cytidylyltransferase (CMP-KDO synthetase)
MSINFFKNDMISIVDTSHDDVAVIIPSRLGSTRVLQKPLAKIGDLTMIEHVLHSVGKTNLKHIYVATDSDSIAEKISAGGYKFIMTNSNCPTGTDRVYEALQNLADDGIKYAVNVQGDMPFVDAAIILDLIERLKNSEHDIITPVSTVGADVANSESNVKVVKDTNNKALYFSRNLIPFGASEYLYHIGVYGFKRSSLEKFVKLPKSPLEIAENLEQLRALENGMSIGLTFTASIPISVDTKEDLAKAIEFYNNIIR